MVSPVSEEQIGVWISLEQAQLLRDMCVGATAQDAKTKIRIGEVQLALESQIAELAPKPQESRQIRRANSRRSQNGHAHTPAATNP